VNATGVEAGFEPLRVRAYLASGVAHAAPWGIALDGILAAEMWADAKAAARRAGGDHVRALDRPNPPDLELPLARCGQDQLWHWTATCGFPEQQTHRTDVRTWTGRADRRALEQLASSMPKVVSDRQGRYRARRMPLLVTPCPSVVWHAIGDVEAIRTLVSPIVSVGKKRSSGEGHVLRWEVERAPDLDMFAAGHLHPDGTLGRPTPSGCLTDAGEVMDGGVGRAGLRPPYMHPSRQLQLHLPADLAS
jgi:CRISPR type IV-associated protein Csf3